MAIQLIRVHSGQTSLACIHRMWSAYSQALEDPIMLSYVTALATAALVGSCY